LTKLGITLFATLAFGLAGSAQTFTSHPVRIPGGAAVQVTGINDSGTMVANYTDTAGFAACVMISGSTMTQLVDPNQVLVGPGSGTSCWAINNAGQIAGSYSASSFGNGFLYSNGVYSDIIVPTATAGTTAYGLNNTGSVSGSFADNVGQHAFVYNVSAGTFTTLDVPGAAFTLGAGINDSGEVVLQWLNSSFTYFGAIYKAGHFRVLNVPNMADSAPYGINVHGWINFAGRDSNGVWHGFLYKGGVFTQYDVANSANTLGFGINDSGVMVGFFNPASASTTQVGFQGRIH